MNKTKIPWALNPDGSPGYTWNPLTGCLNGCEYCYARKLANTRLRERYLANENVAPLTKVEGRRMYRMGVGLGEDRHKIVLKEEALSNPFYPRFWEGRLAEMVWQQKTKPKGIFVCDMSDLFGIGIPDRWQHRIFSAIKVNSQHRFYLLTKQPQNLQKFSPFPDNCWVGVSATNQHQFDEAVKYLKKVEATVKFISFEPLLQAIDISSSIGYNTEYESKEQREYSLQDGGGRGIGDRHKGENMEGQGPQVGQMEGRKQNNTVQASEGGERYGEISPSADDG